MPGREVHIHDAHRRIIQHITRESLALDRDSADRTPRPEESAHALPLLLLHFINERGRSPKLEKGTSRVPRGFRNSRRDAAAPRGCPRYRDHAALSERPMLLTGECSENISSNRVIADDPATLTRDANLTTLTMAITNLKAIFAGMGGNEPKVVQELRRELLAEHGQPAL